MLHAGLDLSRKNVDVCLLSEQGERLGQLVTPPDGDALRSFARRIEEAVHGLGSRHHVGAASAAAPASRPRR